MNSDCAVRADTLESTLLTYMKALIIYLDTALNINSINKKKRIGLAARDIQMMNLINRVQL